jgi:predicted NAD/FAD-binding protein
MTRGERGFSRRIAVIGTGISGLAAAWLLGRSHDVTVYEKAKRIGGHSNTVLAPTPRGDVPIDMGFIVYNEATYPNLVALFDHFKVRTQLSCMSLSVSLDDGDFEYSGGDISGLVAQRRNLVRPRFWSMLKDLHRFYRRAPSDLRELDRNGATLGEYLAAAGYGAAFQNDHLLPMAAAIWSASTRAILDFPAAAFVRFYVNHGLLRLRDRPPWRTVSGGSRVYLRALTRAFAHRIRTGVGVCAVRRSEDEVSVIDRFGASQSFDEVIIATHSDQALALLDRPTSKERRILGGLRYRSNTATLHSDPALMPKRRRAWSSWNILGRTGLATDENPTVTYWMNSLHDIPSEAPLFVTLNATREPRQAWAHETYAHPQFDSAAIAAQRELWSLQGEGGVWFCGAYFGAGFHEDGLQAGLAVAEALGGVHRPWSVPNESSRIVIGQKRKRAAALESTT